MLVETLHTFARGLWRIRGTLLIQVVLLIAGAITWKMSPAQHQRSLDRLGFDYRMLTEGRVGHLLTGAWIQVTPGIQLSMLALVFGGTVFLEILVGTRWMLVTCITGDWVATVLTALTTRILAGLGSSTAAALLSVPDAGTSALAHAGYGAAVMLLPRRWLKLGISILIVLTAVQFALIDIEPAIAHAWAALYGGLIGWFILRPRAERSRVPSSDDTVTVASPAEVST